MKLKNLGDLLVFDTFPLMFEVGVYFNYIDFVYICNYFQPKQKIIITHLLHLEEQTFPQKLPMILTTQKLANQLRKYCYDKKHTVRKAIS